MRFYLTLFPSSGGLKKAWSRASERAIADEANMFLGIFFILLTIQYSQHKVSCVGRLNLCEFSLFSDLMPRHVRTAIDVGTSFQNLIISCFLTALSTAPGRLQRLRLPRSSEDRVGIIPTSQVQDDDSDD